MLTDKQDIKRHLDDQLDAHVAFSISDTFSYGFEIWKKNVGGFLGFVLIYCVISFFLSLIPFIGQLASYILISPALTLGAYLVSHDLAERDYAKFDTFFGGFKFSGDIVLSHLIVSLAYIAVFIAISLSIFGGMNFFEMDPQELLTLEVPWWISLLFLLVFYLSLIFSFITMFIGIYKLNGIESLQYSIQFAHKHLLMLAIFVLLTAILVALGIIGFFIGVFITATLYFPLMYAAFRNITGYDHFKEEDIVSDIFSRLSNSIFPSLLC